MVDWRIFIGGGRMEQSTKRGKGARPPVDEHTSWRMKAEEVGKHLGKAGNATCKATVGGFESDLPWRI